MLILINVYVYVVLTCAKISTKYNYHIKYDLLGVCRNSISSYGQLAAHVRDRASRDTRLAGARGAAPAPARRAHRAAAAAGGAVCPARRRARYRPCALARCQRRFRYARHTRHHAARQRTAGTGQGVFVT